MEEMGEILIDFTTLTTLLVIIINVSWQLVNEVRWSIHFVLFWFVFVNNFLLCVHMIRSDE